MATIGLRRPYYAKYTADDAGNVTYTNGGILAKAVEFSTSIKSSEDNNLHADDGIAETDRTFAGGTGSLTTDDLTQEASAAILGITPSTIQVGEESVTELIYDETMEAPNLGIGVILTKIKNGVRKYRAVVLTKVIFNIPDEAATTQKEAIEWQTPVLNFTIMRDDTSKRKWKREGTFDDELKARAYIEQLLGIGVAP